VVNNSSVSTSTGKNAAIPVQGGDSLVVAVEVSDRLALFSIPDLNCIHGSSDSQDIGSIGPRDRRNIAFFLFKAQELLNLSVDCVPEIDATTERNSQDVAVAPVKKVQVVIVDELRSIQDLFGVLGKSSWGFLDLDIADSLVVDKADLIRKA